MIAWIVGAFYLAGIVLSVDAVMRTRTSQGAIAWSVSLVTMPFVAVPAYLVLGRSKFEGMTEAYDARQDEIDDVVKQARANMEPWVVEVIDQDVRTYEAVRKLSGMRLTQGNRVELLINGEANL